MAAQQSASERADEKASQAEASTGATQPNSWVARAAAGLCRKNAVHDGADGTLPSSAPLPSMTEGHVALATVWVWPCVRHSKPALSRLSPFRKLKMTRHAPAAGSMMSACNCAAGVRGERALDRWRGARRGCKGRQGRAGGRSGR